MKQPSFYKRLFFAIASLVLCNQLSGMQRSLMTDEELDIAIFQITQNLLQVTINSSTSKPTTLDNAEMTNKSSDKKRKRDDANDKLNKEQLCKQRPTAFSYLQGAWGDLSDEICNIVRNEIRYILDPDSQQPIDVPLKIKNDPASIKLFNRIDSILDPLILAIQQDNDDMIGSLIINHALYNLTMDPLIFAIQQRNLEMVKSLIDADAVDVNYATDLGLDEICELLPTKVRSKST